MTKSQLRKIELIKKFAKIKNINTTPDGCIRIFYRMTVGMTTAKYKNQSRKITPRGRFVDKCKYDEQWYLVWSMNY